MKLQIKKILWKFEITYKTWLLDHLSFENWILLMKIGEIKKLELKVITNNYGSNL